MAARRLIIVMLILLGISTLLAAALPDRMRESEEDQTASEVTTETTGTETGATEAVADDQAPRPKAVRKALTINADRPEIRVIPLDAGDQLTLTVLSSSNDLVEISQLGFVDAVGPDKPATIDILADLLPGPYGIRLVEAARTIGRIEVTQPAPEGSGKAPAGDRP